MNVFACKFVKKYNYNCNSSSRDNGDGISVQEVSNNFGNFAKRSSSFDASDGDVVFDARLGQQNVDRMSTRSFHGTDADNNVQSFSGRKQFYFESFFLK